MVMHLDSMPTGSNLCGIPPAQQYRPVCDGASSYSTDVLWPPRCGKPSEWKSSNWPRQAAAQCIAKASTPNQAQNGFTYNITFADTCNVHATMTLRSVEAGCRFRMDVCRLKQLLRSNVTSFWDGLPLPAHWQEATSQGPAFFQDIPHLFNVSALPYKISYAAKRRMALPVLRTPPGSKRFRTCAVVGGAPSLLQGRYGKDIDGYDAVFRFNDHPLGDNFTRSVGTKTTVRVLQNMRNMQNSAHLIDSKDTLMVQIICRNRKALEPAILSQHERVAVYSPEAMLAFHQHFMDEVGGTGPYGIWLSLLLCDQPPVVYGFSQLHSNLTTGFAHYYRGSGGEQMLGETARPGAANVLHAIIWLHVLDCLRLIKLAPV